MNISLDSSINASMKNDRNSYASYYAYPANVFDTFLIVFFIPEGAVEFALFWNQRTSNKSLYSKISVPLVLVSTGLIFLSISSLRIFLVKS